jgi:hypothetical protein
MGIGMFVWPVFGSLVANGMVLMFYVGLMGHFGDSVAVKAPNMIFFAFGFIVSAFRGFFIVLEITKRCVDHPGERTRYELK